MKNRSEPQPIERVSIRDEPTVFRIPKADQRVFVEAVEPGFAIDPVTKKVRRLRRHRNWLGFAR